MKHNVYPRRYLAYQLVFDGGVISAVCVAEEHGSEVKR